MSELSISTVLICISECLSALLIWKLWRGNERAFFKCTLSLISVVPVLGPLLVIWLCNFPEIAPPALQDRSRPSSGFFGRWDSDFLNRWDRVFKTRDPDEKLRAWQDVMSQDHEDNSRK